MSKIKEKSIIFTLGNSLISDLILKSQSIKSEEVYDSESLFSHVLVKPNKKYIYESTFHVGIVYKKVNLGLFKINIPFIGFHDGARKSNADKLEKKIMKDSAVAGVQINFNNISDAQWNTITAYAEMMVKNKHKYGKLELLGTLMMLWKWKRYKKKGKDKKAEELLKKKNVLDKVHASYCCAFVASCFKSAGVHLTDVEFSVTIVDDLWWTNVEHTKKMLKFEAGLILERCAIKSSSKATLKLIPTEEK